MKQVIKVIFIVIVVLVVIAVVGIQFLPVDRSNPPVAASVQADAHVLQVLHNSCFDCHSNETRWPWYAYVAPVSWLVTNDVHDARKRLNFSNWEGMPAEKKARLAGHIQDEVEEGGMPLANYLKMHPGAKLSDADARVLDEWAAQFLTAGGGSEAMGENNDEHEHEHGEGD